jgi:isochorismate hydrolase
MDKYYLTEENISSKADEWLNGLDLRPSRQNKFKFNPQNSALLIIDMQEYFLSKESHAFIPAAMTIVPNINSIIKEYRKHNLPIIFTFHALERDEKPGIMGRWWGDVLRVTSPLSRIHSSIRCKKSDIILRKSRYSAFVGTNLDQILKNMEIDKLVITGVMTHLCCDSTARDAFMKDYGVYFVVDATATDDETLHVSSLRTLSDGFVIPIKTNDVLKEVKHIE